MPESSQQITRSLKHMRDSKYPWSIASSLTKPPPPEPSSKENTPNSSKKTTSLLSAMDLNVSLKITFLLKLISSEESP